MSTVESAASAAAASKASVAQADAEAQSAPDLTEALERTLAEMKGETSKKREKQEA